VFLALVTHELQWLRRKLDARKALEAERRARQQAA
jgi:hypothetical protein